MKRKAVALRHDITSQIYGFVYVHLTRLFTGVRVLLLKFLRQNELCHSSITVKQMITAVYADLM
ncbi:unnamed protein product [Acanthoscelides obtectus]|uniref:Uncharacterized protein n=1 Tax=Acanthoscelides obtectus TaxID=200917 RepID=A0A9P0KE93_ACAOB|nr:unnamed protein product [Acanthoscelides obtectus]CAK1649300.1 hypothetical protein AOBTE_LOCUS16138 [Acanthoscelides obtectus]